MTDLAGRTFLVTGANAGIGYATATELARRGGRVHIAGRSRSKGEAAAVAIAATASTDPVLFLRLDLASLASVREAAEEFIALDEPLHRRLPHPPLLHHRPPRDQGNTRQDQLRQTSATREIPATANHHTGRKQRLTIPGNPARPT